MGSKRAYVFLFLGVFALSAPSLPAADDFEYEEEYEVEDLSDIQEDYEDQARDDYETLVQDEYESYQEQQTDQLRKQQRAGVEEAVKKSQALTKEEREKLLRQRRVEPPSPRVIKKTGSTRRPLVDINRASAGQIAKALPEINRDLALRIVAYREKNGPFRAVHDVQRIPGFGVSTYERIKRYLRAGGLQSAERKAPKTPERKIRCWKCKEGFTVSSSTSRGVCPRCGARWAVK